MRAVPVGLPQVLSRCGNPLLHDERRLVAVRPFGHRCVVCARGHADIATTMIYVHHVPQDDAADKLTKVVAGAESALLPADEIIEAALG